MEEHVVALQLQHSREQLRAMLLPGSASGQHEPDEFPRSAVMRFLLDSGKRRLAITVISSLLMLAGKWRQNSWLPRSLRHRSAIV